MSFNIRALARIVAVVIASLPYVAVSGPTPALATSDDALIVRDHKNQDESDLVAELKLKYLPVFVLVPGILGSSIDECPESDDTKCHNIWGTEHNDEDLLFEESMIYKTKPLIDINVFGAMFNIYGTALSVVYNLNVSSADVLLPFSYDWRQDNRLNAVRLQEFLCSNMDSLGSRPVIFVSHSMGGLVVKYWYKTIYSSFEREPCANGHVLNINISEFIFAGTPHHGSPSAVKALANGYDFTSNSQGIFGRVAGKVTNAALASKLNKSGTLFPSVYQLLPVYTEGCVGTASYAGSNPIVSTSEDGEFSVFDAVAWKKASWPRYIAEPFSKDSFYEAFLSKTLYGARSFLCEISDFNPPNNIKVTYFVGVEIDTPSEFKLDEIEFDESKATNVTLNAAAYSSGDGTVPADIARNMTDHNHLHSWYFIVEGSHQELLDSDIIKEHLSNIMRLYKAKATRKLIEFPGQRARLIEDLERMGSFVWLDAPESSGIMSVEHDVLAAVGLINAELMRRRGLEIGDLRRSIPSNPELVAVLGSIEAVQKIPDEETIKVGVLHSLSGTMAISETALKDVMLMLIEEQNKNGGLLGKKLEAVVVDAASDWPRFAELARKLLDEDKVAATFGCWTSVSRKSVLPVFEELNGILFYPVQYEGEESSKNIFYTGAAPNQQAIPAVDYLAAEGVERWVLAGTDYVYPRTTNKILEAYLKAQGVADEDIMINYTPFGHSDWQNIIADIKKFGLAGKKTAVVSTINGDANVPFYKELGNQGIKATDIPVVAFSVGEEELAGLDTQPLIGHLAVRNYFMNIESPENQDFIEQWINYKKNYQSVASDPMEAHVVGFKMWVAAVEKAGTTEPDAVIDAIVGVSVPNLSGSYSAMMPNHHITKPVLIGEIQGDGQFDIVWKTPGLIAGDEWSDFLPDSKDLISDWRAPMKCGNFNVATGKCGGAAQ